MATVVGGVDALLAVNFGELGVVFGFGVGVGLHCKWGGVEGWGIGLVGSSDRWGDYG